MSKYFAILAATAFALAACGGGGSSEEPPLAEPVQVGGVLAGLGAGKSLTLAHVDGAGATVQSAGLSANGAYSLRLPSGTAYNLRVLAQPAGQTCTVSNGTGTATADVSNIAVLCKDAAVAPESRPIAGKVAGLGAGKNVVLQLTANGAVQEAVVNADGSFQFLVAVTGTFTITVKTSPIDQACSVVNGQGTAGEAAAVTVTCVNASLGFKLGGTVSGSIGAVALRNASSGETITLVDNGGFAFTQPVLSGTGYAVSVIDKSPGQSCSVANGSGTAAADVNNLAVTCIAEAVAATPPAPVLPPAVPTGLTMTYGVKSFNLAWGTVTAPIGGGAVSYRLFEDADGPGPAASAQIGGALTGVSFTHVVNSLLHTRLNAQYRVQACNSAGCSASTTAITPNITQAIGYFKASNTALLNDFGYAVTLSNDGSTLAVGSLQEPSNATGINGNQVDQSAGGAGAVYIYARTGSTWTQQAYVKASNSGAGDNFGYSVALSGDGNTLAVGAHWEDSAATGANGSQADNGAGNAGAVYVYTRTGINWSQQAYLKASNTGSGDEFGQSLALSTNGDTLAVGAPGEGSAAAGINGNEADNSLPRVGAAYIYIRTGNSWSQQAYVKASNPGSYVYFGWALALSGDGGTLAVGAYGERSNATGIDGNQANVGASSAGAVYVYTRAGANWTQQAYVKASNTNTDDWFGWYVALSGDGSTLAVGAIGESSNATGLNGDPASNGASRSGAAYVYSRTAGVWAQQAYVKASNTRGDSAFGYSVALSSDGNTLAVAAVGESSGATGLNGNQANNAVYYAGAAYLYSRSGGTWTQQAYVKASHTGVFDSFGWSLALSGDGSTLAVGARGEESAATGINGNRADNSAPYSGAVFLY